MLNRLLIALDQRKSRRAQLEFAARLGGETGAGVCVLHVLEFAGRGCAAPLETRVEASPVVEEAVFVLRMAGVGASGLVRTTLRRDVASLIVEESERWSADAVLVGAPHRRGVGRLLSHGVRDQVIRRSSRPVLVAPACALVVMAHAMVEGVPD